MMTMTMMTMMTMVAGVSEYQCLPLNHFPPVSVCLTSHIFIQGAVMNVLCFFKNKKHDVSYVVSFILQ